MADCRPTEKSFNNSKDLTSLSNIINTILGLFKIYQKPANAIPPPLLLIGKNLRPGMSARNLAASQISKREQNGEQMGDIFADGENKAAQGILSDAQEMVNMIQTQAKVDVAIDPGAILVTVAGTAGPFPVVGQGANVSITTAGGGIT